MKVAFIVNARNKAKYVGRAVQSALSQTYPCEILLSDQSSDDGTYEAMEKAVADWKEPHKHEVRLLRCPIEGKYGMEAANAHTLWLAEQTQAEWLFQCSADDYSLPRRVETCLEAARKHPCSAVACTMFFTNPDEEIGPQSMMSGYPTEDGYVSAGVGLNKMAYGSTIQGWRREFLLKVGSAGLVTGDVYHGFLAALDKGYYVVANPQHVHVMHSSLENMGFQGKMRAAEASGDKPTIHRINELNRYQLFELYYYTKVRQQQLYPLAHAEDQNALVNMMLSQAVGWYNERANLHKLCITPWTL